MNAGSIDISPTPGSIDVRSFIDDARFGSYQRLLIVLCFLTAFLDGYDVQSLSVAAPQLKLIMGLQPAQLGSIFAAGTSGTIISALTISWFADRWGRRPLMIASMFSSGALSIGYVFATTFAHLFLLRLVGGFCLAAAVTAAYTYAAEIAPKRALAVAVMVTSTGYGFGITTTGFLSGTLIELWGWHAIFYFGGGATLAVAALLWLALPESPRIAALRPSSAKRLSDLLARIDPRAKFAPDQKFHLDEDAAAGLVVRNLLAGGRMRPAIGLWASCFFFSFAIYTLMQWLPTIVAEAGGDPGRAGSSLGLFKLGGIVSSLALAAYIDRRTNPYPLMTMFLALSVAPVLMLARASPTSTVFTISVGLAGILLGGLQYAWNALIARLFPTSVRAAGVAVYKGFAAVGALIGPLLAGVLLQLGWTASDVLAALIVPIAMAMFTVAWLSLSARKRA